MSFRQKPHDWYSLTYEQQKDWERADRELKDEHYARERAEQDAEDAREDARRELRRHRAAAQEEMSYMQADMEAANAEIAQLREQRDALVKACEELVGTIAEHEIESLSCDRDGETYCNCLRERAKEARAALALAKEKP